MALHWRKKLYLFSGTLRGIFFILMLVTALAILLWTQKLVHDLRQEARQVLQSQVQTLQKVATDEEAEEGLSWYFENVVLNTNFPLVLTDPDGNPISWKNIKLPEDDASEENIDKVRAITRKMATENKPVAITYNDQVISYLYYGDSNLITQLVYLPYVTLSALGMLLLAAFLGYRNIIRSEQSYIWVGMAKETAHQLGTPISSLMGWIEMIAFYKNQPDRMDEMAKDMASDVKRLEKVALRFSQIGSQPEFKSQDIHSVLRDIIDYFRRRLPHMSKETQIVEDFGELGPIPINRELFEWAIENLLRNALDAMRGKGGTILISTGVVPDSSKIFIDIKDNGIGIHPNKRKDVFKAGYSTKKRGWGLGLNFTKRIIHDYHRGKIFIKESQPDNGTTMRIVL